MNINAADYSPASSPVLTTELGAIQGLSDEPVCVPESLSGQRLDKVLATLLPEYSRSRLQTWIEDGHVLVNGERCKPKQTVYGGDALTVEPQVDAQTLAFLPESIALNLLFEDQQVCVVNKPAGLVVHPAAGNWSGTLLNGLLGRYPDAQHLPRAGIVHRLDKDTSGLMVVARSLLAHTDLIRQLQARTVKRRYLALVWGQPKSQMIEASMARDPGDRLKMAVVRAPHAKPAVTYMDCLQTVTLGKEKVSLVECRLETGRTHQIRVHMAHIGHPLLGDPVYGRRRPGHLPIEFTRQALHAWQLGLIHPETGEAVAWNAVPPEDFCQLVAALGIEAVW
jgi:23S rRNA pseudouridine1911/1915/1917 synthase